MLERLCRMQVEAGKCARLYLCESDPPDRIYLAATASAAALPRALHCSSTSGWREKLVRTEPATSLNPSPFRRSSAILQASPLQPKLPKTPARLVLSVTVLR